MSILQITTDTPGQIGVVPRIVRIKSTDTLSVITAPNYLQYAIKQMGFAFYPTDIVAASYAGGVSQFFTLTITSSAITLVPMVGNIFSFDVTVPQASLASAGSVTLVASSGTQQYKVRNLQLNSGGTNFSGGSGNRLGQVTDGTTVYSVIPAATLQTLVNAQWGVTALPNPASAAINTSTAAGASLVFKYSGGTTDYTAGSLVITGVVERVA